MAKNEKVDQQAKTLKYVFGVNFYNDNKMNYSEIEVEAENEAEAFSKLAKEAEKTNSQKWVYSGYFKILK